MKLNEGPTGRVNLVRGYGSDGIRIGAEVHPLPLLLTAQRIDGAIQARTPEALTSEDVARILDNGPEIVLVGSLDARRPSTALRRDFEARRIAVESMDLGAACRTYNVLVQEDRPVLALLFA